MIVPANDARVEFNGNGVVTVFTYDFAIVDRTHVQVYVDGILRTLDTHYDVTGIGNEGGGTLIFVTPPPVGIGNVILVRHQPVQQNSIYTENEEYPPLRIQNDLNMLVMGLQQLQEKIDRTFRFPVTSLSKNMTIATPVTGQFLRWADTAGNIINGTPVPAGSVSVPLSFPDGGTGGSYANRAAMLKGTGGALWGNTLTGTIDSWTVSAGILQVPDPITNNATYVATPLSGITTTGIRPGTEIALHFTAASLLTHSATFFLQGRQNYTAPIGNISHFVYNGSAWIEYDRYVLGNAASNVAIPEATRLTFVSGTQIKLGAFKGRYLPVKTSGVMLLRDIGSSGIVSANPTAALNFVDGVALQTLVANQTYLVTVFDNSGTLTFDFRTNLAHSPDSLTGVEIKNGDDTRTVVGMVRTNATPNFQVEPLTVSWFNSRILNKVTGFTADRTTVSASLVELHSEIENSFLVLGESAIFVSANGSTLNSGANTNFSSIGFDTGAGDTTLLAVVGPANTMETSLTLSGYKSGLAEGLHFATLCGAVSAGTGTWRANVRLHVAIRG